MNKLVVAIVWGAASLVTLPGCKQIAEARKAAEALKAAASAASAEAKAPVASTEEEKDAELGNKLSEYIDCMNGASKRVVDSRNRYLSWIKDEKAGPSGKERVVYGLYEVNTDSCYRALDKAQTLKPSLPDVESAADQYKKALSELEPVIKQANRYYEHDDYKDDKMAKGKELHPLLMNAFAKFAQINKGFEEKVVTLNDGVNLRQFQRLEKDATRRFEYLSQKALYEAKAVIKLSDVGELKELDQQKFDVAVQSFDRALGDLQQYATDHKAEASKVSLFSSYVSAADEFLKSAKELLRRKRDNKDFNKEFFSKSSPIMVSGHPAQLIEKYNRMVNSSNGLRF
jgi:Protein of unknown function (DUF3829)